MFTNPRMKSTGSLITINPLIPCCVSAGNPIIPMILSIRSDTKVLSPVIKRIAINVIHNAIMTNTQQNMCDQLSYSVSGYVTTIVDGTHCLFKKWQVTSVKDE